MVGLKNMYLIKMGQSLNLISVSEVQNDKDFHSYLKELDSYFTPEIEYTDKDARYPSLSELYQAFNNTKINIVSEKKAQDTLEQKTGKDITIHIFEISDDETKSTEDLTIRYETQNITKPLVSIAGIKTDVRILIKLSAELTKVCGAIYILSPYESFFIDKNKTYTEIWSSLLEKNYRQQNL